MRDYTKRGAKGATARAVPRSGTTAEYDEGLRAYMLKVYNHMGLGLAATGIIAFLTVNNIALLNVATQGYWLFALAELGFVIYFTVRINKMSEAGAKICFYSFAALNGLTLAVILNMYTGASVARVFFITAAMFGSMSIYGYTTKKDLTGMGGFLIMGLIGIVIASIVNIFMQSSALHFAISIIGVFVFIGLTAYDTQKIKQMYYTVGGNQLNKVAIQGALSLYLDFINLMIMMLRLFGERR